LKVQERDVDRKRVSVELARKEYYPDFSLGFTYFDRDQNPEMYGLMFKAKVPLYFWRKQRPELESAKANLVGSQKMRDNTLSTVHFQLKEAYIMATTSERLVKLYSTVVVPQATLSLHSAIASYQVGKADFLTLIDSALALLDYELKSHESMTDFQKALAQMEPLVGVELTQ
jgi:outer membrane protein TolC